MTVMAWKVFLSYGKRTVHFVTMKSNLHHKIFQGSVSILLAVRQPNLAANFVKSEAIHRNHVNNLHFDKSNAIKKLVACKAGLGSREYQHRKFKKEIPKISITYIILQIFISMSS